MFSNALLHAAILLSPTASAQADLSVEAIWVTEGADVTVSVVVSNQGTAGAEDFSVDLYGSKGGLWLPGNSPNTHYSEEIPKLSPGKYVVLEFVLLAEEWGNPEDGMVFAAVDVLDAVAESDEGDNFTALVMLQDEGQGLEMGCSEGSWVPSNLLLAPDMNQDFLDEHPSFPVCKAHGLLPD